MGIMEATKRRYQKHKTEYKITVKHYLNKNVMEHDSRGERVYPVYVQVTHKSKNSRFRSRINPLWHFLVDRFNTDINSDDFKQIVERDTALIVSLINEYSKFNDLHSKKNERNYDVNDLPKFYHNYFCDLAGFVDYCLVEELHDIIYDVDEGSIFPLFPVKPLIYFEHFVKQYPQLNIVKQKYDSNIWVLDIYLYQMRYQQVANSEPDHKEEYNLYAFFWNPILQDFKDGYAQKYLLQFFKNSQSIKDIITDIEKLILKYSDNYFANYLVE